MPLIEAADPSGELAGVACVLLREVDGDPADCSSPEFTQAGQVLRQVHGVTLMGHGLLTASPEGLQGEHRAWADAITERTGDLGRIADSGLVDAGLLDPSSRGGGQGPARACWRTRTAATCSTVTSPPGMSSPATGA